MTATLNTTKTFGFSNLFSGFSKGLENYRLYSRTVKELSALSDRELADLDISRWDIDRIAREAVASN